MNPNTPPPSDDDLPDERELAAFYARLPKPEPDPALDAAVLAQAARVTPLRRRPRWPVALGSAAVLVLAFGVAWQVRDTRPPLTPLPESSPEAAPAARVPQPEARVAAAPPAMADAISAREPAKPAPRPIRPTAQAARHAMRSASAVTSAAPVPTYAPAPPAPPAPPLPASPAPPLPASPPMASSPPAPPEAGMAPVEPAPTAVPQGVREATPEDSATLYAPGVTAGRPSGQLKAAAPAPDASAALPPDDRVGEIRRLLGEGQRDEALRRLRDLRRRYPHYDLPQDLRDLKP